MKPVFNILFKPILALPNCFSREPQWEAQQESQKVLNSGGFIFGMGEVSQKGCVLRVKKIKGLQHREQQNALGNRTDVESKKQTG